MKVKIIKCSDRENSYGHLVGKVFKVNNSNHMLCVIVDGNYVYNISSKDTVPVSEIRYESLINGFLNPYCTYGNCRIPSIKCSYCEHNCGIDKVNQTVQCSWQEESDKMNLKSIAVRFENKEQREEIRSIFKEKGFKVLEIMSTGGVIGYADGDDYGYVCSLSTIGLIGKKILSYEEFTGGKDMNRLDIRNMYKDDTIIVIPKENEDNYVLINVFNSENYGTVDIRIGDNYTDIDQANEILKVIGLDYELYESVNWQEVEEGAEVKVIANGDRVKLLNYIPDLKTLIVRCGDSVFTIDEDKVELV